MTETTASHDSYGRPISQTATIAAYTALGSMLVWSRLVGLDRTLASDELATVRDYIHRGPKMILAGEYIPNNHQLFSLLGWATTSTAWDSVVAVRLWSAIPFILGVLLITAWLHVRVGTSAGILFLFFATCSPLLLDITWQARGYGLAFLAMAVLIVSALEAVRSADSRFVIPMCVAGTVGTWTLPNFGVGFVAVGVILLTRRELSRATAIGLSASIGASLLWYMPHVDDILEGSRQEYALPIRTAWLVTAPFDQILFPALGGIDETLVDPKLGTLLFAALLAVVVLSSPLLRDRDVALILLAGPITSILVLWITQTRTAPRFLSFLLVPLLMLLASGTATIFRTATTGVRPPVRAVAALAVLVFTISQFVDVVDDVTSLPREATREAARVIDALAPSRTPVIAYVPYAWDIEYYLGRSIDHPRTPHAALRVCDHMHDVIYVAQPWVVQPVQVPCTQRRGVRHVRLRQYARGGSIDIWLIPPSRG